MMQSYSLHNAVVQLVPVSTDAKPRKAGSAQGLIQIAHDFDAALFRR